MSIPDAARPLSLVVGCAGLALTPDERAFLREADPLGLILFKRNCETPAQVRALTAEFRVAVGRDDAPVLIDQEGGRVARLRPPFWPAFPAAAVFGRLAGRDGLDRALEIAALNARIIARTLRDLGVDMNCAPVLDVPVAGAHDVIGDRAPARDPATVAALGRAMVEGAIAGGVGPIVKHLPGHGRATVDSHHELPRIRAPLEVLEGWDFAPFRALADAPAGMVAHVVVEAVDPDRSAGTSPIVIRDVIRGRIGFDGLLFSDDIGMNALSGTPRDRAAAVAAAGVDVVLQCDGILANATLAAEGVGRMSPAAWTRWERARPAARPDPGFDPRDAIILRDAALAGLWSPAPAV